jgi:hypothetical protein
MRRCRLLGVGESAAPDATSLLDGRSVMKPSID